MLPTALLVALREQHPVLFQALSRKRSSAVVFFYLLIFYFVDILMEI